MSAEAVSPGETPEQKKPEEKNKQRVAAFIKDMRNVKFAGARGSASLDSYFLLSYDRETKNDRIDYVSWTDDESRYPSNFISSLSKLELPKGKDHPPFNKRSAIAYTGEIIPVIAFGMGPEGRAFLFRRKDMSTKISFERIKRAVGIS